jgi:CHAD domain-containing protein
VPTHLEIETKYAVGPAFVVPAFTGVAAGVTVDEPRDVELSATYYDTADLRLTANRISLRRRVGGDDEGWHVKIPAGNGRLEIRRPLDGDEPPVELTDLVRAHVRRGTLRPVARIDDHRTIRTVRTSSGEPVLEIADDRVSGRTLQNRPRESSWREVEVELLGPEPPRWLRAVERRLHDAGASTGGRSKVSIVLAPDLPDEPTGKPLRTAGDVVRAELGRQVGALVAADVAVRQELPDSVHAMRTAANRIRADVRAFRRIVGAERASTLDVELSWLRSLLGDARDAEVVSMRLLEHVAAQPVELVRGPVVARIRTTLDRQVREAQARLLVGLASDRYLPLLDDLDQLVASPLRGRHAEAPVKSLDALLAGARRKVRKRVAAARTSPKGATRDAELHRARRAAKRLRYTAEACAPQRGRSARRLARAANRLADHLGERQDAVVTSALLTQLASAAEAAPGESAFTFGLLLGLEQARIHQVDRRLPEILAHSPFSP